MQKTNRQTVIYGFITTVICFGLFIFSSCRKEVEKINRSQIIPEKELVPLLTDIYLSDGLLSIPEIRLAFSDKDSTSNYMDVIGQHGYTKERMDMTIHYYLMRNPRKLQKIYDQVIAGLSELETRIETESVSPSYGSLNIWPMETTISVPESGLYNMAGFEVLVRDTGMYSLTFDAIVYKDDQSLNLRSSVFFWKSDTSDTGMRDTWNNVELTRDGIRHSYSISKRLTDTTITHIKGFLAEHDPQPGRWQKHLRITDIHLIKGGVE